MLRSTIENKDYTLTEPYFDLKPIAVGDNPFCSGMKKLRPFKQQPKGAAKKAKAKRRMSKQSRKRNR